MKHKEKLLVKHKKGDACATKWFNSWKEDQVHPTIIKRQK